MNPFFLSVYTHVFIFPTYGIWDYFLCRQLLPWLIPFSHCNPILITHAYNVWGFHQAFVTHYPHNQMSKKHVMVHEMCAIAEFVCVRAILSGTTGNTRLMKATVYQQTPSNTLNHQDQLQPAFPVWAPMPKRVWILKTRESDKAACIPYAGIHQGGFKLV